MSDNLRDVVLFAVGAGAILVLVLRLIWVKWKNSESECSCPPTVLKKQDGGFTTKVFHRPLCRFFKKGTPP